MGHKIGIISKNTTFFNQLNKVRRYDHLFSLELVKSLDSLDQIQRLEKNMAAFVFDSSYAAEEIITLGESIVRNEYFNDVLIYLAIDDFEKFRQVSSHFVFSKAITLNVSDNPEEVYQKITSNFRIKEKTISNKKPISDAMFLNIFIDSTISSLQELCGSDKFQTFSPTLLDYSKLESEICIRGCLEIVSPQFQGKFFISFPKHTFVNICQRVLNDTSGEINQDNEDLVSEICNIVYGKSKVAVAEHNMGLGMVIPTRCREKQVKGESKVLVVKLVSEFGEFYIKIAPKIIAKEKQSMLA